MRMVATSDNQPTYLPDTELYTPRGSVIEKVSVHAREVLSFFMPLSAASARRATVASRVHIVWRDRGLEEKNRK